MINKRLSIILPCYNVEKYIAECLNSIYNQDIPESEYEVICVNDCPPDKTREILVLYQQKHTNLSIIDNKINLGLANSRNAGFDIAKGKYIWYIDSDDYIESNVIKSLIREVESNDLDILNFEFKKFSTNDDFQKDKISDSLQTVVKGSDFILSHLNDWWKNGSVSRKIFKRSYLLHIGLRFSDSRYLEDQIYSLRSVYFATRFKHIEKYCYYYRYNPNSLLNSEISTSKYLSILIFAIDLLSFSDEISTNDSIISSSVDEVAVYNLNNVLKPSIYFNHTDRKKAFNLILPYVDKIENLNHFRGWRLYLIKNLKVSLILLYFISPILRFIKNKKKN